MPYTEAVICEIFRYSSIVCGGVLHSTTIGTHFQGYFLPKDTIVMANLYNVHHSEKYWGDPENFRPERFLAENAAKLKEEAFMPFSTGKRVCIAENMAQTEFFLFFTGLLQNFNIKPDPNVPLPDWEPNSGLVLSPKPYQVIFESRL